MAPATASGPSATALAAGYVGGTMSIDLEGAVNLMLQDMGEARQGELVAGPGPQAELWVHCAGGFRASVAASLLARAGHGVVASDDGVDNASDSGLAITP